MDKVTLSFLIKYLKEPVYTADTITDTFILLFFYFIQVNKAP